MIKLFKRKKEVVEPIKYGPVYDSLRKLPKVIQIDIYETGNVRLLTEDINVPDEILIEIWERLDEEYNSRNGNKEDSKILPIIKEIDYQANRYLIIKCACSSLLFDKNDDLILMLKEQGYSITDDNYINDIERILRESEGIILRIKKLKEQLPKEKKQTNQKKYSIVDIITSYGVILNYPIKPYEISVEEFESIEKSVHSKIESLEQQNTKN
ncbi:hypothetical protein [uncultured Flavobacterium sp.]|uniref:hypothetical protein n=1 Tax=uncultured Flavobacterium sp. TaxID=165435 RepID=UPI0030EF0744|tara:strand:+ start:37440 stop:38075 length:636 start_codon:yes stop_codon:yes gene_type:complete